MKRVPYGHSSIGGNQGPAYKLWKTLMKLHQYSTSIYRLSPGYPHDEPMLWWLSRGQCITPQSCASSCFGDGILHTSTDVSTAEILRIKKIPHGDVPFLGPHNRYTINSSSNSIHAPNAINAPHQCLASPTFLHNESTKPSLIVRGANTLCYNRRPPVHPGRQRNQLP
jgi:hypothetical protein